MRHSSAQSLRVIGLTLALSAFSHQNAVAQRGRAATPGASTAPEILDSNSVKQWRWRHIGPEGNRVTSVSGVAGDRKTYYAGAASGGLWKTTDAGVHWKPVFDDQPVSSVGALAVSESDHNVVWAGTGEPFIRSNISVGWGVFRSTDAGKSFTKMGLDNTGRIARVVIHPTNPDVVFVAALGHGYGPQPDRGIFRTSDGGKTWEKVLFVNDSTGASELVMDPNNPRILYAGFWQVEIHTWGRTSGGAGSGIWKSTDGGTTWKRLTGNGLPTKTIGKIGLGISKANSNRIYALIETGDGVPALNVAEPDKGRLFRSDDGGANWQMVNIDRQVAGRTHYYNRMGVSPDNQDEAYFLTASWAKTLDGGRTIIDPPGDETPGGDHHDIWIDPTDGNRMAVGHDGGISITENRGKSWNQIQLPIAQMYHATVDNRIPYFVYGNRQDGPSTRGPSNSKSFPGDGGIPRGAWSSVGGGESGWATPDPVDSNLVWSSASGYGSVGGIVSRWDIRTNMSTQVEVWPQGTIGMSAAEVKYRFVWTFPLTISPHDHNKIYVGSQHVHMTTNGGRSWQVISPDLTRNDRSRMVANGGLTPDNIGVEYSGVVFAIAESKRKAGLIWAGTNDGKVQVTQDGGTTWTDVTPNLGGAPDWGTISNIEPSSYDDATAYLSIDGHQSNSRDPFIYKTTDYGKTWKLLVNG
ncbi:MAG: sialidase, partial [Gemmatimonadaceae bacterium]